MAPRIGQRLNRDLSEPVRLLSDRHRRTAHFLDVLIAIDAEAVGRSLTPECRRALEDALRDFAVRAPRYARDENAGPFEHDVEEAAQHHMRIDTLARQWLAEDRLAIDCAAELRHRVARLRTLYARHTAAAKHDMFPNAAHVPARDIRQIGRESAAGQFPAVFD